MHIHNNMQVRVHVIPLQYIKVNLFNETMFFSNLIHVGHRAHVIKAEIYSLNAPGKSLFLIHVVQSYTLILLFFPFFCFLFCVLVSYFLFLFLALSSIIILLSFSFYLLFSFLISFCFLLSRSLYHSHSLFPSTLLFLIFQLCFIGTFQFTKHIS